MRVTSPLVWQHACVSRNSAYFGKLVDVSKISCFSLSTKCSERLICLFLQHRVHICLFLQHMFVSSHICLFLQHMFVSSTYVCFFNICLFLQHMFVSSHICVFLRHRVHICLFLHTYVCFFNTGCTWVLQASG